MFLGPHFPVHSCKITWPHWIFPRINLLDGTQDVIITLSAGGTLVETRNSGDKVDISDSPASSHSRVGGRASEFGDGSMADFSSPSSLLSRLRMY